MQAQGQSFKSLAFLENLSKKHASELQTATNCESRGDKSNEMGKMVCRTSPVELDRSIRFVGDENISRAIAADGAETVSVTVDAKRKEFDRIGSNGKKNKVTEFFAQLP